MWAGRAAQGGWLLQGRRSPSELGGWPVWPGKGYPSKRLISRKRGSQKTRGRLIPDRYPNSLIPLLRGFAGTLCPQTDTPQAEEGTTRLESLLRLVRQAITNSGAPSGQTDRTGVLGASVERRHRKLIGVRSLSCLLNSRHWKLPAGSMP